MKFGSLNIDNLCLGNDEIDKIYLGNDTIYEHYIPIEYIESTGTQYIDTNWVNTDDYIIELKTQFKSLSSNHVIFGNKSGSIYNYIQYEPTVNLRAYIGGSNLAITPSLNVDYTISASRNSSGNVSFMVNGSTQTVSGMSSSITGYNSYLFATNYNNTAAKYFTYNRLYYCKIYENSNLVRDYIPVVRSSDGEVGLFDKVNQVFYTNQGEGKFEAPFSTKVYQPLEYIESSGTQYIDTGILDTEKTMELVFAPTNFQSGYEFITGSDSGSSGQYTFVRYANSRIELANGSYSYYNMTLNTNQKYKLNINQSNSGGQLLVEGTPVISISSSSVSWPNNSLLLFTGRTDGGLIKTPGYMKMYYCKIYQNNTLVRSFIPALRRKDSVAGLYDLVTGKFYTNAGSGSFTYQIPSAEYTKYNYLQSDGTQWINSNITMEANDYFYIRFHNINSSQGWVWGQNDIYNDTNPTAQVYQENGDVSVTLVSVSHTNQQNYNHYYKCNSVATGFTGSIGLFCTLRNGKGIGGNLGGTQVYSLSYYKNNILYRDFIPVQLPNGTNGLYNKISRTFYGNMGSGDFTIGN